MSLLKNWYHHTNSDVWQNVSHLLVHLLVCVCMSIFWSIFWPIFWPIFINFKYIFCIILYLLFKSHKKIFYQKQLKLFYRPSVYIYFLVNLYIWLTISSCYDSIPLTLGLIGRDGGLSTLCHTCGLACQQRMLKTFVTLAISVPRMG